MLYNWKTLDPFILHVNLLACEPGFSFGPRTIQDHQFIYVLQGKGSARIQNRHYEVAHGNLYYYGPEIIHEFRADSIEPFVIYGLHFCLTPPSALEIDFSSGIRVASFAENERRSNQLLLGVQPLEQFKLPEYCHPGPWIDNFFAQLLQLYLKQDDISCFHSRAVLMELLLGLFKWTKHQNSIHSEQAILAKRIQRLLELNAELSYSRKWLKDCTPLHENHAALVFKQQIGLSPHAYHIQQKIIRSQQLLKHTELSISAIAEQLHFSTQHYFSKLFKKVTGLSPSEYRNLRKFI